MTKGLRKGIQWVGERRVDGVAAKDLERLMNPPSGLATIAGSLGQIRKDGWLNTLTGMGDPSRDKSHNLNSTTVLQLLTQLDAEVLWRADDMAARIIERVPDELIREGFEICVESDSDKSMAEDAELFLKDIDALGKCHEAICYARAYGGGGIFLGADDGNKDLTKPLDLDRIKSFEWMNVLTPLELFPRIWYGDPKAPKYGEVEIYRIQRFVFGGAVETGNSEKVYEMPLIHESRLVRFDGVRVSRRHLRSRNGWGDSVLMRVLQVLSDFQQGHNGAAILIQDFSQAVFKIKGLAELLAQNDSSAIAARAQGMDLARSIARAVIIDKDEDFERKSTAVTGLPELLDRFSIRLAAASDMPVTLLMGQSPAGLNATGASDLRWFYDRVKAIQIRKLQPALERILRVAFRSKGGPTGGKEPKNWSLRFRPLWQPTLEEQAKAKFMMAQGDVQYIQNMVLSPAEVRVSRFAGDEYSMETVISGDAPTEIPITKIPGKEGDPADAKAPKGSAGQSKPSNRPNPGSTSGDPT